MKCKGKILLSPESLFKHVVSENHKYCYLPLLVLVKQICSKKHQNMFIVLVLFDFQKNKVTINL